MTPITIQRMIDVKRLKHQLWETLQPKLDFDSEFPMTDLMDTMYYDKQLVDPGHVSVHSAFICMLHLANEKGIVFKGDE